MVKPLTPSLSLPTISSIHARTLGGFLARPSPSKPDHASQNSSGVFLRSQSALVITQSQKSQFFSGSFCPLQKRYSALEDSDLQFPGVDTGREGCGDRQSPDASDTGEGVFSQLLLRGQVVPVQNHSGVQNQGHIPPTIQSSGNEVAQEDETKTQGQ